MECEFDPRLVGVAMCRCGKPSANICFPRLSPSGFYCEPCSDIVMEEKSPEYIVSCSNCGAIDACN